MSYLKFEASEAQAEQKAATSQTSRAALSRLTNRGKEKTADFDIFEVEENPISDEVGERYVAQFAFTAATDLGPDDEPQLSLKKGDEVLVTDTSDAEWYTGRLITEDGSFGDEGVFPAKFVARLEDLEESAASSPEIDAEDVIDPDNDECEEPQWKTQRIQKLQKVVRQEHHASIGILEARDLLENSTWNVTKATVLYKRRRAPKASDREFSTDDAKQCAASIVAASGLFAGLMAILASFPPATI